MKSAMLATRREHDLTVTLAAEAGQLELKLKVMEPVIAQSILESMAMLRNRIRTHRERCIDGITAKADLDGLLSPEAMLEPRKMRSRKDSRRDVLVLILASFAYISLLSTHNPRVGS